MRFYSFIFFIFLSYSSTSQEIYHFNNQYTYKYITEFDNFHGETLKLYCNNENLDFFLREKFYLKKDYKVFEFTDFKKKIFVPFIGNKANDIKSNSKFTHQAYTARFGNPSRSKSIWELNKLDSSNYLLTQYSNSSKKKIISKSYIEMDETIKGDNFKFLINFWWNIKFDGDYPIGVIKKITWYRKNKKEPNYTINLIDKKEVDYKLYINTNNVKTL